MSDTTPPIGHNLPPNITESLTAQHAAIFDRCSELIESFSRVPTEINDDDTHKKALDLYKMMRVSWKSGDETRKIEKEPWSDAAKEVDGCFGKWLRPLKTAMDALKERTERYSEILKERERIAREEKAQAEREAAEQRMREAQEAEARKLEAERQKRKAQEEAAQAEREKKQAQEDAMRKQEEAQAAKRAAAWADQEREQARLKQVNAERAEAEAKKRAEHARIKQRAAETEAQAAARDVRAERRIEKETLAGAVNAEKRAAKLDGQANASAAELSRQRSDRGTVGSIAEIWVADIDDIDAIPLEQIRGFISHDAIRVAVNLFVKAGGRELPGVTIELQNQMRIV